MSKTALTFGECLIVIGLCFGLFIFASIRDVASGFPEDGFDDTGTVVTLLVELALATTAIGYLRWRRFDVAGLVPRPSGAILAAGGLLFLASWIVGVVVTLPLHGSQSDVHVQKILINSVISASSVFVFAAVNGFYEEAFLLGVLQRGQS